MFKSGIFELEEQKLNHICGGTVNDNPNPEDLINIDELINDDAYEKISDWIVEKLQPAKPRTRKVNNNQNIYDFSI